MNIHIYRLFLYSIIFHDVHVFFFKSFEFIVEGFFGEVANVPDMWYCCEFELQ